VRRGLGQLETTFFAYMQMRELSTVRMGELRAPLQLSATQERKLLSRLAKAGLIARVWRGLYLVPPRLPLGGKWSPSEAAVLNALMADQAGRYQICGPNAFNRYGFDGQIPIRTYAYNNRISGDRTAGSVELTLIKVADERLGGTETTETAEGQAAVYSSRARALVDGVYDWSRFNSLPQGFEWIQRELAARRVGTAELVKAALKYGDTGTVRRIGAMLERDCVDAGLLRKLSRVLKPTTGLIAWIPSRPKRGTVNRRWGVVFNGSV